MQSSARSNGTLSPSIPSNSKKRLSSAKDGGILKARLNKVKSTEYEKKGTNELQVENEHLRTLVEKLQLERGVAESRLKDVELL